MLLVHYTNFQCQGVLKQDRSDTTTWSLLDAPILAEPFFFKSIFFPQINAPHTLGHNYGDSVARALSSAKMINEGHNIGGSARCGPGRRDGDLCSYTQNDSV